MSQEKQTTVEIDLPMNKQTARAFAWIGWSLVLLGTVSGAVAAMGLVPQLGQQVASGVSVISMLVANEIRRQLPAAGALNGRKPAGEVQ